MSIREELRQEIEETRQAFHALLASIPEEAFDLPSDNPAWTIGRSALPHEHCSQNAGNGCENDR